MWSRMDTCNLSVRKRSPRAPSIAALGGRQEWLALWRSISLLAKGEMKGIHSSAFELPPSFLFPRPHLSLKWGRETFWLFLPIPSRARHEQLNLGLPCGLWITVHSANHQGTKADNKKEAFLFFVYPSGHCLPYHWRGNDPLIPFGNCAGFILQLWVSNWPVIKWVCQPGAGGIFIRPFLPLLCPKSHEFVNVSASCLSLVCLSVCGFHCLSNVSPLPPTSPQALLPFSLIFLSKPFLFLPSNENDFPPFLPL